VCYVALSLIWDAMFVPYPTGSSLACLHVQLASLVRNPYLRFASEIDSVLKFSR
jgi:hypothetical protein